MNQVSSSRFKFFSQLNKHEGEKWLNSSNPLSPKIADAVFGSGSFQDLFLRHVAEEPFLPVKEVLESFEFFERIRKPIRSSFVVDLCCGHGLLGILFAMFEPKVERVLLIDKQQSNSRNRLISIAAKVAPWTVGKISCIETAIEKNADWIEKNSSIVSQHACGTLSDLCIDIAIASQSKLAILPCCYPRSKCPAPLALQTALGFETAFDVHRTYRLEHAGYRVRWANIPDAITPMNRIVYGQLSAISKNERRSKHSNVKT